MTLLIGCLTGVLIGFIYDLFRIFRYYYSLKKQIVLLLDLMFFILITLMTLLVIIAVNEGQLRGFILLCEIIGSWIYFNTISPMILNIFKFLLYQLSKLLKLLNTLLIQPLGIFFQFIFSKFQNGWRGLAQKLKFLLKKCR